MYLTLVFNASGLLKLILEIKHTHFYSLLKTYKKPELALIYHSEPTEQSLLETEGSYM